MSDWRTKKQLLEEWSCITRGRLDYWIQRRGENGLDRHIQKKGSRLYIDARGFAIWFDGRKPEEPKGSEKDKQLAVVYRALEILAGDNLSLMSQLPRQTPVPKGVVIAQAMARAAQ